jgi:hypothetical protein
LTHLLAFIYLRDARFDKLGHKCRGSGLSGENRITMFDVSKALSSPLNFLITLPCMMNKMTPRSAPMLTSGLSLYRKAGTRERMTSSASGTIDLMLRRSYSSASRWTFGSAVRYASTVFGTALIV